MNKSELYFAVNHAIDALNKIASEDIIAENGFEWKNRYMELKEQYETLCDELEDNLKHAEAYLENMKAEGLTFNTIESEGYLRCAKRVVNIFESLNERGVE